MYIFIKKNLLPLISGLPRVTTEIEKFIHYNVETYSREEPLKLGLHIHTKRSKKPIASQ